MKYLAILLLTMSFIGIGAFSLALFDMGPNHQNNNCVASAVTGTACPTSTIGMALLHISILQTLTTAIVSSISNWLLLLASLLLISVSLFLFYKNLLLPKPKLLPQRLRDLTLDSLHNQQKITSWLSLFELSPVLQ